ncbi:MAG: hypothetical protein M1832_000318 [Thelocarpon impressellum]|nr:MAG: hypothetical protein M1832_000318 [Thelocarpon impressellum]
MPPPSVTTARPGAVPASLPPSVEQNYRRKCIELKRRMNEVDENNDAYRLRKIRLNRGIMKLRLERAFMLEQLAKRTSTNVEDSEGSPSPPPTVGLLGRPGGARLSVQPKEKPLRIKRGHRRPDPLPTTSAHAGSNAPTSPRSARGGSRSPVRSLPTTTPKTGKSRVGPTPPARKANGAGAVSEPRRPPNAYMIFCDLEREAIVSAHAEEPEYDTDHGLAQAWRALGEDGQAPYFEAHDEAKVAYDREKRRIRESRKRERDRAKEEERVMVLAREMERERARERKAGGSEGEVRDEGEGEGDGDVVMEEVDADADAAEAEPEEGEEDDGEGGFTAVNR